MTGVSERHSRTCTHKTGACTCSPSYVAWVFDARSKKKVYKTFSGKGAKSAAKGWRSDAVPQARKGTLPAPSRLTVEQEACKWIARAEKGEVRGRGGRPFKPSVLRTYTADLHRYVIPAIGHIKVGALRHRDVQERLVDAMLAQRLSASRVLGCLNSLRAVLRRPISHDELAIDPTAKLDLPAVTGSRDRAATTTEAAALLAALPDDLRALYAVAMYAGLRRGELRALRVSDYDAASSEIGVQRGWDDQEGEIAPKSEKGTRPTIVAGTLASILREHLLRTGRRGDDLMFGRTSSEPFTPTHIAKQARNAWTAAAVGAFIRGEGADLEVIGLHEARHSFRTFLDAIPEISEARADRYMGHSDGRVQSRYKHQLPGQSAADAAALDSYLTGTPAGTQTLRMVADASS